MTMSTSVLSPSWHVSGFAKARCRSQRSCRPSFRQITSAAAAGSSNGSTLDPARPQEMLKIFRETQENMMELNRSRLAALEEVKTLRARVALLEAEVQDLEQDTYEGKRPPLESAAPAPLHTEPGAYVPQRDPTITLSYQTGWNRAFLHYSIDGKGWTHTPGREMEQGTGELAGSRVLTLTGSRLEFVINNSEGGWDTPPPGTQNKNYVIEAPGKYMLKSGKLVALS